MARWRDNPLRARSRRCAPSHRTGRRAPTRRRLRDLAAARTIGRSRARNPQCRLSGCGVVRVRGRAFNPDVAALEILVFPDRDDLLHAFNRIAAGRKRVGSMRRPSSYRHAGFTNRETPRPMMHREHGGRPTFTRLIHDPPKSALGERLIRLVDKIQNPPPLIVIADKAEKRRYSSNSRRLDHSDQPSEVEHVGRYCGRRKCHQFILSAAEKRPRKGGKAEGLFNRPAAVGHGSPGDRPRSGRTIEVRGGGGTRARGGLEALVPPPPLTSKRGYAAFARRPRLRAFRVIRGCSSDAGPPHRQPTQSAPT